MKELNNILKEFREIQNNAEPVFLATVVNVQGSSYRRPGARMLITSSGKMVGTISGGCLENDILEHTRVSMADGQPIVVTYDTNVDEDLLWGFGLGCNGVIQVLIEPLDQHDPLNPLTFINQCFCCQQQGIMVTVFGVEGTLNLKLGTRLILNCDRRVITNIVEPSVSALLKKDAQVALQNQHSAFHNYQLAQSKVNVFIELIEPPIHLIIFGAGSDALPVAQMAKILGWKVTVVDCRAIELTKERFPMADQVILTRRDILHKQVSIDEYTVAVVMTHNYLDDLAILKMLQPSSLLYVGCLGSKQRCETIVQDLLKEGIKYSSTEKLPRLYAPIGIDIGANTPETIALSIIAEIQAVLSKRSGGFLKDSLVPIHRRNPVKEIQILNFH